MTELAAFEPQAPSTCPECRAPTLRDTAAGEVVCRGCGLVVSTIILSREAEWTIFEPGDYDSAPRGTPMILPILSKGASTMIPRIGWRSPDPETRATIHRLNWLHRQTDDGSTRNFYTARNVLLTLGDMANVPWTLIDQAATIYRKAYERRLVRGRNINDMMAGSIYAAYRLSQVPKTLRELAKAMNVDHKDLSRIYRLLHTELGLRPERQRAEDYVPRLADALGFTGEEVQAALNLLKEVRRMHSTAGKHPRGLAAAALYIACKGDKHQSQITQEAIAKAAGVTSVTIRNQYKHLKEVTA